VFAVLPTVGGQTALNLAVELADSGVLERYNVELIGAKLEAIKKAEDRLLFKDAMARIGLDMPKSQLVRMSATAWLCSQDRLSRGHPSQLYAGRIGRRHCLQPRGDDGHPVARPGPVPVHECLIEESVLGWKEYELR